MPLLDAEALALRHYSLAEADRIVVLLTREAGLLRAVARGARKPKSRLGACLQPLNHLQLQYYLREGADLAHVRQCETIHPFLGGKPSLDQVCGFTYLAELTLEMTQENNPAPLVFRLLLAVLRAGEQAGVGPPLLRYFELWLLRLGGLLPNYDYCSACRKCVKERPFHVWMEPGQCRCPSCAQGGGIAVGAEASRILRRLMQSPPLEFATATVSQVAQQELERLSRGLLDLYLEKRLKSLEVYKQLTEGQRQE